MYSLPISTYSDYWRATQSLELIFRRGVSTQGEVSRGLSIQGESGLGVASQEVPSQGAEKISKKLK